MPRLGALAAAVIAVGMLAAACSGDDPAADAEGSSADSTVSAEAGADSEASGGTAGPDAGEIDDTDPGPEGDPGEGDDPAEPQPAGEGGHILLLSWQAPSLLNPYLTGSAKDLLAASLVLEPLAEFAPDGELVPVLATEIPSLGSGISTDLTQITWTLRDDIVWSDGTPLSNADVEFSFAYCTAPDSGCAADFGFVESVEAVGDHQVTITFSEPRPWPFDVFVGYSQPIISEAQFADCLAALEQAEAAQPDDTADEQDQDPCHEASLAPMGTGPFAVSEFVPDDFVRYELNPRYRGVLEGKPFFGSATLSSGGDAEEAARSVLVIGEADYAWNVQVAPEVLADMEAFGNGRVLVSFGAHVETILLNQTDPAGDPPSDYADGANPHPFFVDNPRLARALSLAIDRQALVDAGYGPTGRPTCGVWPLAGQAPADDDWCLTPDPAGANRILDDLGYLDSDGDGVRELPDGTALAWEFVTSTNAVRQAGQDQIAEDWAAIGVEATMRHVDPDRLFAGPDGNPESMWRFATDILMFTHDPVSPDPLGFFGGWRSALIPSSANDWTGANIVRLADAAFDDRWERLASLPLDDPQRAELIAELNGIVSARSGAAIPLVHRGLSSAVHHSIDGVGELNPWDSELWNIEDWVRR